MSTRYCEGCHAELGHDEWDVHPNEQCVQKWEKQLLVNVNNATRAYLEMLDIIREHPDETRLEVYREASLQAMRNSTREYRAFLNNASRAEALANSPSTAERGQ